LAAHPFVGRHRLLGTEMPVGPRGAVGAAFDHGQIEGSEALTDLLEPREQAGVAGKVDAMPRTQDRVARPQGAHLVEDLTSGGMTSGRRNQAELADLDLFPPIELANLLRRDAPVLEMRRDPERDDEGRVPRGDRLKGRRVEMVVVV